MADRIVGSGSVVPFLGLTFALSWGAWGTAIALGTDAPVWCIAGAFGPAMAALILASRDGNVRALLSGFRRWRAPAWVWAFAFGGAAAVGSVALWIEALLGGQQAWPSPTALVSALAVAPLVFGWVLVFSVAGEETGWRGYMLPRLLLVMDPVRASLLLAAAWGVWHLPLWFLPGDFHRAIPVTLFLIQIAAFSILYTWLWLRSDGSLVVAHAFHAASNTTLGLLPLIPGEGGASARPLWIAVGLLCVVAVLVARGMGAGEVKDTALDAT